MLINIKKKALLLSMLAITTGLYVWVNIKWGTCLQINCSEYLIDTYLSTIKAASGCLIIFFLVLISLPHHYFKAWIKYIFSWGFPLSVYLVYITEDTGDVISYSKTDIVRLLALVFAIISIVFICGRYFYERK